MSEMDPQAEIRKISRRSLLWAGAALIGGYGGFRFLASRHPDGGLAWPLRRTLQFNEDVWTDAFSQAAMAPTFDPKERTEARVNGMIGLSTLVDNDVYALQVENGHSDKGPVNRSLMLADIRALPRHEFTTQLCCIEGWSIVVTWAGVRFRDFAAKYLPPTTDGSVPDLDKPQALVPYVYMQTPNGGYYVGLDMQSALHPQTLLCYEMNGEPLSFEHGAPLRLVIPTKYGVKNLKCVGLIRYCAEKPRDYWAEQGYDWYAGL